MTTAAPVFDSPIPHPPTNDYFINAIAIAGLPFSDAVDMNTATTEDNEPQPCTWSPATVWYAFTPASSGLVKATLSGYYDNNLVVYQAAWPDITGLSYLACAAWNSPASVAFNAAAGTTYYFQVGKNYGGWGTAQLDVEFVSPPTNDNFTSARVISVLPYDDSVDYTGATREANEPSHSCGYMNKTAWYAYTPAETGSVSQRTGPYGPATAVAVYTGNSLIALQEVTCRYRYYDSSLLTFRATAGVTYYFQVGTNDNVSVPFHLDVTPPPTASFGYNPYDPSTFDTMSFYDNSYDPANIGIQTRAWNFGDGSTATDYYANHRYSADGDYTVTLMVTTYDGRTASTTQVVHVKTHDVTITKFSVPQSAKTGQTRQIVVGISNKRYPEDVEVVLYKSYPGYGWQQFGALRQTVPVRSGNRTTEFTFNYTFTPQDATMGKVTFRAYANLYGARDALPADNEAIALPTKVTR